MPLFVHCCIHTYVHITKYINTTCSICKIPFKHVSRTDLWSLINTWCALFWGRLFLLFSEFLNSLLGIGLNYHGFSPVNFRMFTVGTVQVMFRWSCCDFIDATSVITKRCNLTLNSLILWFPQYYLNLRFWSYSEDVSFGTGIHSFVFWLLVVFCNGLYHFTEKFCWWGVKTAFVYGHKDMFRMWLEIVLV